MPPKTKFTREEIIRAALELARAEGLEAVTARALGAKLGASARPIFSVFDHMEEVLQEVVAAAKKCYGDYVQQGLCQTGMPAFKGVGMQYIRFAIDEPKLFQILFMSEQEETPDIANILPAVDENYPQILASVKDSYQMDEVQSAALYRHLWIYSHGIAVLCATRLCRFTPVEIGSMLTEVCTAMIKQIKGGAAHD